MEVLYLLSLLFELADLKMRIKNILNLSSHVVDAISHCLDLKQPTVLNSLSRFLSDDFWRQLSLANTYLPDLLSIHKWPHLRNHRRKTGHTKSLELLTCTKCKQPAFHKANGFHDIHRSCLRQEDRRQTTRQKRRRRRSRKTPKLLTASNRPTKAAGGLLTPSSRLRQSPA